MVLVAATLKHKCRRGRRRIPRRSHLNAPHSIVTNYRHEGLRYCHPVSPAKKKKELSGRKTVSFFPERSILQVPVDGHMSIMCPARDNFDEWAGAVVLATARALFLTPPQEMPLLAPPHAAPPNSSRCIPPLLLSASPSPRVCQLATQETLPPSSSSSVPPPTHSSSSCL